MIHRLLRRLGADSEGDRDADGYLSYRAEWHAAAWGFFAAFMAAFTGRIELLSAMAGFLLTGHRSRRKLRVPYQSQIRHESLYALGHGAVGLVAGLGLAEVL